MTQSDWPCLVWGTVKLGRSTQLRTPAHTLPSDTEASALVRGMLHLGMKAFDTAPAYGLSEIRIGVDAGDTTVKISTKVGETHEDGQSHFDFTADAVRRSLTRSKERLRREQLDLVYLHAPEQDLEILKNTEAWSALRDAQQQGIITSVGLSGKTPAAAKWAIQNGANALMVPWNREDQSHSALLDEAADHNLKVFIKKGLDSGNLTAPSALRWILEDPRIHAVAIGSLCVDHMEENLALAKSIRPNQC